MYTVGFIIEALSTMRFEALVHDETAFTRFIAQKGVPAGGFLLWLVLPDGDSAWFYYPVREVRTGNHVKLLVGEMQYSVADHQGQGMPEDWARYPYWALGDIVYEELPPVAFRRDVVPKTPKHRVIH